MTIPRLLLAKAFLSWSPPPVSLSWLLPFSVSVRIPTATTTNPSTSDVIRSSSPTYSTQYSPSLHLDDESLPIPSFLPYLGSRDVDIGSDPLHRALRSYAHG